MQKKGLSYAELEKLTGVSKSALQRYASGETKKIPVDVIEKIASVTNVTARYLMGWGEDDEKRADGSDYRTISPNVEALFKKMPEIDSEKIKTVKETETILLKLNNNDLKYVLSLSQRLLESSQDSKDSE